MAMQFDQHGWPIADHHPQTVEAVFARIALLTGGACARFDAGAAAELGELLAAVAAFAVGGVKALGDLRTESARKLLDADGRRCVMSRSDELVGDALAMLRAHGLDPTFRRMGESTSGFAGSMLGGATRWSSRARPATQCSSEIARHASAIAAEKWSRTMNMAEIS